jgi:2-C-methyl-D-erythritol 4-phosphate cytidylyltransferase
VIAAVVTAAGSGSRLGRATPKALVSLGGTPLVAHAAQALQAFVDLIVVTAPAAYLDQMRTAVRAVTDVDVVVVAGRGTRQGSVSAALDALSGLPDVEHVLVHDAARPTVPSEVVARVVSALHSGKPAVIPAIAVVDTIKSVAPDDEIERVTGTVPRDRLRAVQTPQGFDRDLLVRAHTAAAAHADDESVAASDDAGLVEMLGEPVWVVLGDARAAKITTEHDLSVAQALWTVDHE